MRALVGVRGVDARADVFAAGVVLALKDADIGIAMGRRGTQVAQEAAVVVVWVAAVSAASAWAEKREWFIRYGLNHIRIGFLPPWKTNTKLTADSRGLGWRDPFGNTGQGFV